MYMCVSHHRSCGEFCEDLTGSMNYGSLLLYCRTILWTSIAPQDNPLQSDDVDKSKPERGTIRWTIRWKIRSAIPPDNYTCSAGQSVGKVIAATKQSELFNVATTTGRT